MGWSYGQEAAFSYRPKSSMRYRELLHFLESAPTTNHSRYGPIPIIRGEVVFNAPVSLRYLTTIRVLSFHRDRVIRELREAGISTINGRPIEDVVVPVPIKSRFEIDAAGAVYLFD